MRKFVADCLLQAICYLMKILMCLAGVQLSSNTGRVQEAVYHHSALLIAGAVPFNRLLISTSDKTEDFNPVLRKNTCFDSL